jgi:hypothetical protein
MTPGASRSVEQIDAPMDDDRRRWLERLAEATDEASDELRRNDDPRHHDLIEDLEGLRERVRGELEADPPGLE